MAPPARLRVVIEQGSRRSFATAADWPGWSRPGRTPEAAVEALLSYARRYGDVARSGGHPLPRRVPAVEVVEVVPGNATTDFGAPGRVAGPDLEPVDVGAAARLADLVGAAWAAFDDVVAGAPATLTTGPRGGGRSTGQIVAHVMEAEAAYARKLGVDARRDPRGRAGVLAVLATPNDGTPAHPRGWPTRYAAGRIAWHALDHAWEIEDRTPP